MPVVIDDRPLETSSAAAIERWRQVPVAVAVDVSLAECQIDRSIRPLCAPGQQPRLFSRAVTALCEPPDFGAVLYALDKIKPGDVLVIAAGGNTETAMIGEILGGQLRRLGACGLVCDGAIRDVAELAKWSDLSVFSRAITPRGPTSADRGRVNCSVVVGGRLINPGDLIIGDDDGLVSLDPKSIIKLIGEAEGKLAKEAEWQSSLAANRTVAETFQLGSPQAGER